MNPWPNPQFPLVTEERSRRGRTVYTYADREFPFSIQYLIYEPPDEDSLGMIAIIGLIDRRGAQGTRDPLAGAG
jgi:hypothetical protein